MANEYPLKLGVGSVSLQTLDSAVRLQTIPAKMVEPPAYEGDYEITPSAETQTLATSGKLLARDITINPIPNNYGLIAWNGSVLTVS